MYSLLTSWVVEYLICFPSGGPFLSAATCPPAPLSLSPSPSYLSLVSFFSRKRKNKRTELEENITKSKSTRQQFQQRQRRQQQHVVKVKHSSKVQFVSEIERASCHWMSLFELIVCDSLTDRGTGPLLGEGWSCSPQR